MINKITTNDDENVITESLVASFCEKVREVREKYANQPPKSLRFISYHNLSMYHDPVNANDWRMEYNDHAKTDVLTAEYYNLVRHGIKLIYRVHKPLSCNVSHPSDAYNQFFMFDGHLHDRTGYTYDPSRVIVECQSTPVFSIETFKSILIKLLYYNKTLTHLSREDRILLFIKGALGYTSLAGYLYYYDALFELNHWFQETIGYSMESPLMIL
jgi:hypothetical protein